jgi:hypothetical protein
MEGFAGAIKKPSSNREDYSTMQGLETIIKRNELCTSDESEAAVVLEILNHAVVQCSPNSGVRPYPRRLGRGGTID